jgi:hypothetical protein
MADLEALIPHLAPLDRAMVALHVAERDGTSTTAHLQAVVDAWIRLDAREQLCKLHYFHDDRTYGASLRAVLDTAVSAGIDVGALQAHLDAERGRPWP